MNLKGADHTGLTDLSLFPQGKGSTIKSETSSINNRLFCCLFGPNRMGKLQLLSFCRQRAFHPCKAHLHSCSSHTQPQKDGGFLPFSLWRMKLWIHQRRLNTLWKGAGSLESETKAFYSTNPHSPSTDRFAVAFSNPVCIRCQIKLIGNRHLSLLICI